jgi:hypothetical protein
MLTGVPTQINRSARLVTLRHPNAIDCTVFRKQVNRVETVDPDETNDGAPTIGGLGMLNSEDESDYEYTELGDARIVFVGQFQTQGGNWTDDDGQIIYPEGLIEALIECELEPDNEGFFLPKKNDIVSVEPGEGLTVTYEVVDVTGPTAIPPYTRKYVLNPRQDQNVGI